MERTCRVQLMVDPRQKWNHHICFLWCRRSLARTWKVDFSYKPTRPARPANVRNFKNLRQAVHQIVGFERILVHAHNANGCDREAALFGTFARQIDAYDGLEAAFHGVRYRLHD